MISDAKFTSKQLEEKMKDFGQLLANKVAEKSGAQLRVKVREESPASYLICIEKATGNEFYNIRHLPDQTVESISVYMV